MLFQAAQTGCSAQIRPLFLRWRASKVRSAERVGEVLQRALCLAALNDHLDAARALVALPGIEAVLARRYT